MDDCIFCKIRDGKIPSLKILDDAHHVAIMDIHPGSKGHCLVIPKQHREQIYDMTNEELERVGPVLKKVATACREGLGCDGVNLVQSNGSVAFQSIFHVHFHVVPRYSDDNIRLPWSPKPADPKELESIAAKIKNWIR